MVDYLRKHYYTQSICRRFSFNNESNLYRYDRDLNLQRGPGRDGMFSIKDYVGVEKGEDDQYLMLWSDETEKKFNTIIEDKANTSVGYLQKCKWNYSLPADERIAIVRLLHIVLLRQAYWKKKCDEVKESMVPWMTYLLMSTGDLRIADIKYNWDSIFLLQRASEEAGWPDHTRSFSFHYIEENDPGIFLLPDRCICQNPFKITNEQAKKAVKYRFMWLFHPLIEPILPVSNKLIIQINNVEHHNKDRDVWYKTSGQDIVNWNTFIKNNSIFVHTGRRLTKDEIKNYMECDF